MEIDPYDLLIFAGRNGVRFKEANMDRAVDYLKMMIEDGRILTVDDEEGLHTFIAFSITDSPERYLDKDDWEYYPHNRGGRAVVIEKIVSRGFNKALRKQLQSAFLDMYPNLEFMFGYRWARHGDRKVTYRRKDYVRN